tara:strand:- start:539 stop:1306 length:768 start_codon:yes stop_codon:yes gene_type:complete
MLIDSHCHLDFADFTPDRDAVIARAEQEDVSAFVVPATTVASFPAVLALVDSSARIFGALGLHPYFLSEHGEGALAALHQALDQHAGEIVALGECGFDARLADHDAQWQLFEAQLSMAREFSLPVIVHCVRANDEVAKRIKQARLTGGGIIHAFAGSQVQAERFLELGFVLGLGGSVTYPRANKLRGVVASLPDDGFVLETDSPDMPLCGFQGQRNEPSRVAKVADVVAELRSSSRHDIALSTTTNVQRILQLNV